MAELWRFAVKALDRNEPTTLIAVTDAAGSVPGKPGAMIVVTPQATCGTIGGGVAEYQLVERARTLSGDPVLVEFTHVPESGSLCQGCQTFALIPLTARDQPVLRAIITMLERNGHGVLRLSRAGLDFTPEARPETPSRLQTANEARSSPREVFPAGPLEQTTDRCFIRDGDSWSFVQTLGTLHTLYIIGGGHVALALSRVMVTLPFRVVVLDDRKDLPTMLDNTWASETRVISYADIAGEVLEGKRSWVVIMTHGHRDDQAVLEQLVGRHLAYLGMMGSTAKVATIFNNLTLRGISPDMLEQVHAPVGLPIGSHSPAEIAISIAAEIIKVQDQNRT